MRSSPFLILNFGLDIVDSIRRLHLEGDSLPCEGLDEDLHGGVDDERFVVGPVQLPAIQTPPFPTTFCDSDYSSSQPEHSPRPNGLPPEHNKQFYRLLDFESEAFCSFIFCQAPNPKPTFVCHNLA